MMRLILTLADATNPILPPRDAHSSSEGTSGPYAHTGPCPLTGPCCGPWHNERALTIKGETRLLRSYFESDVCTRPHPAPSEQ